MWIATQYGFFSIVKNQRKDEPNTMQIRERCRGDLENLQQLYIDKWEATRMEDIDPEWGKLSSDAPQIIETPQADYGFRMIVHLMQLMFFMSCICQGIDYPNFKNMIHDNPDQADKLQAYSDIWSVMYDYQNHYFSSQLQKENWDLRRDLKDGEMF